jgi:hypothetical protein
MADGQYSTPNSSGGSTFAIINIIFVIVGCILIYYLYRFLNTSAFSSSTVILPSQQAGNVPPSTVPKFPKPYEGGDYSVNTWIYVSSFNNINTRKHILELKGEHFSTLLIALGAFKNSLVVRTQYLDPGEESVPEDTEPTPAPTPPSTGGTRSGTGGTRSGTRSGTSAFQNYTPYTSSIIHRIKSTLFGPEEGFQNKPAVEAFQTPNTADTPGNLSQSSLTAMFNPMASDDSLVTGVPIQCDIPEIDLQRWTMITVVLSGRTIDVFIDGKLSRSCVTDSYFRVDPTKDTVMNITDRGGFDGYIGNTVVGNYSMSPDEIYKTYLSGPNGAGLDVFSWVASIFKGANV